MVRSVSRKKPANAEEDELEEELPRDGGASDRTRLKKLAISRGIFSGTQSLSHSTLAPSKTVLKHHGKDILRKSQRKNRYLFSFPGLLGPVGGGKIGELKDLGTKNPILYLEFPQGLMKLFGTIVYPKNRYLTLQFSKGGKNVMCEDYFDNMIVFSDAWWIGRKDENPEEIRLDFPEKLSEQGEFDFHGGAGTRVVNNEAHHKSVRKNAEESLQTTREDDRKILKDPSTPTRFSERTAGRKFKFAETNSGDDPSSSDGNSKVDEVNISNEDVEPNSAPRRVLEYDDEKNNLGPPSAEPLGAPSTLKTMSKQTVTIDISSTNSAIDGQQRHRPLIQPTLSTIFKKALANNDITTPRSPRNPSRKGSDRNIKRICSKRQIETRSSHKGAKVGSAKKLNSQSRTKTKRKVNQDILKEEDEIESFSSSSVDCDDSDTEWGK